MYQVQTGENLLLLYSNEHNHDCGFQGKKHELVSSVTNITKSLTTGPLNKK